MMILYKFALVPKKVKKKHIKNVGMLSEGSKGWTKKLNIISL